VPRGFSKNTKNSLPGFVVIRYSRRTKNIGRPPRAFVPLPLNSPSSSPKGVAWAP
jgi:hypothetical protein